MGGEGGVWFNLWCVVNWMCTNYRFIMLNILRTVWFEIL